MIAVTQEARALLRLARFSMATRERDVAVFQYPDLRDAFLVLDAVSFVRRPEARFARGVMCLNDRAEASAMRARFLEIWAASYPAVSATTLGL